MLLLWLLSIASHDVTKTTSQVTGENLDGI